MTKPLLTEEDLALIKESGMNQADVSSQIEIFKKGIPFLRLARPCVIGDGIDTLAAEDLHRLGQVFSRSAQSGRAMKFVPASGAASRMFKSLLSVKDHYEQINRGKRSTDPDEKDPDYKEFLQFISKIEQFAFYDDLKTVMSKDGLDLETLLSKGQFEAVLDYALTDKGLDLSQLPKGLIQFHKYPGHSRTPFEEHLVEAAACTQDSSKVARVHFTISSEQEKPVKDLIDKILSHYEKSGVTYEVTFSTQKRSTDTIAVDMENRPFRDSDGTFLFRPGGHGALLENLEDVNGDLVFIKNIDNVVPDRLKGDTTIYKRALGGYLVELQREIFVYLEGLSKRSVEGRLIREVLEFARERLSIVPSESLGRSSREEQRNFLFKKLNRPLRICGMVKNEGEPGGGPFWVEHVDGACSRQIVESSQVDMNSAGQKSIWESSTYFNPVDMVCGVRDYKGNPFDLTEFTDPNTGFISIKSKDGRDLKALELPGLWNGSMANWNTLFVEVPISTFNPVKTVLDLLRSEHRDL